MAEYLDISELSCKRWLVKVFIAYFQSLKRCFSHKVTWMQEIFEIKVVRAWTLDPFAPIYVNKMHNLS